jgi:hypothetical protein
MKYFTLAIASCVVFSYCSKDDNNNTNQPSKTDLLTSASWKYDSGGVDLDKNGTVDLSFETTGAVPACLLDNVVTFKTDGSGVNDEGTTKCDPALPQTSPFAWAFANSESAINISGSGFAGATGQFKIKELSSTKLSLSKDTTISNYPAAILVNLKH